MNPLRWIAERREPALKCARVGHRLFDEWRRGYQRADYFKDFRAVVVDVRQTRRVCARCGAESLPWTETRRSGIQSFSAPSTWWDAIERGGYWREQGREKVDQ